MPLTEMEASTADRVFGISLSMLFGSFVAAAVLAPIAETYMLRITEHIYAVLRSFCHQMPSRSLWFRNSAYGLCSHCVGIFVGLSLVTFLCGSDWVRIKKRLKKRTLGIVALLVIPLFFDAFMDFRAGHMNPHWIRLSVGFLAGGAAGFFLFLIFDKFKCFISTVLRRRKYA